MRERKNENHTGKVIPYAINSRYVVNFEKEARKHLGENDHVRNLKAGAILIESQLHKVLGSFFLFINKPDVPARLFTDREKALKWLEQFKL